MISRRFVDALNVVVVLLVILALVTLVAIAYWQGVQLHRQNDAIVRQNVVQICAAHDNLLAIRSIKRNLGLPTGDIHPPDIAGLDCPRASITAALLLVQPCTESGTLGDDKLTGTDHHDVLCAKAGDDYAAGKAAADIMRGGTGEDTLVGGSGADDLYGKSGPDDLFATDGEPGDELHGGRGRDNCYGDIGDTFDGCEHVVRLR